MRPSIVYIGGFNRSGTTLVQRLLDQLPDVASLGEVCNLWDAGLNFDDLCTCGKSISRCEFWCEIAERAFGGWCALDLHGIRRLRENVDRARFLPELLFGSRRASFARMASEYADYYARIYAAAIEVSGARFVIDASKRAPLACCLSSSADINLRVVHIVRDSRGVAYSCAKRGVPRVDTARETFFGTAPPMATSLNWVVHNIALEILGRKKVPTYMLTYEHLIRQPVRCFEQLTSFAGIPADAEATGFLSDEYAVLGTGHSIGGNPMRARTGRIQLRLDDAWRTRLPRTDRLMVSALTYPLLRRYSHL